MRLPTVDDVDARLLELLGRFEPTQVTERQRAEDLVASALTLYGGALRRIRELLDAHGSGDRVAEWTSREPLGRLLALHRADTPAPPPIEAQDVRRAGHSIDAILEELDGAPPAVAELSREMLAVVVDLHEAGLAQITGAIDEGLTPSGAALEALGDDDLVASLLLVHGLHPVPLDVRVARVLDDLRRHSGPVATVELVALTDAGAHLRVSGPPSDAYRLRLTVERTLAERVPDLAAVHVDGGAEPQPPTSVVIPVESLTVRRRPAPDAEVSP